MNIKNHINEFAQNLAQAGIRYAFGVAGGGASLELITALVDKGISFYPVAHEAAGALMAGACCRRGKPEAIAISIKGPGFANLLPGIISNYFENRSAITVSEAFGPATPSSQMHKRLTHRDLVAPLVKGCGVVSGDEAAVKSSLRIASEEIPGPIHFDLYNEPAEEPFLQFNAKANILSLASDTDVRKLLSLIQNSRHPAVILGSLAVRRLSEIKWGDLKIPTVTTAAAKGCLDENTPFASGVITGEIKELSPETAILKKADLIIAFGLRNTEMVRPVKFDAPLAIIDTIQQNLFEGFDAEAVLIVSDIKSAAQQILDALRTKVWGEEAIASYRQALDKELFSEKWMPAAIFQHFNNRLDSGETLVLDTGLFCTIGETIWKAAAPENFIGNSNSRFMGVSVPTAIGTAISNPSKKIICVAGDGGIRPYIAEIKLAVEAKLPILFVLMSDNGYGTIAQSASGKNLYAPAYAISNASWWQAVEKMGCPSQFIDSLESLSCCLDYWLRQEEKGPFFIEMSFNPEKYAAMTLKLR